MRNLNRGLLALATLLVVSIGGPALGVGSLPPTTSTWDSCREQDTFRGCCERYGGRYSYTAAGGQMCSWSGTPTGTSGSTTRFNPDAGNGAPGSDDVYQSNNTDAPGGKTRPPKR